jgi:hypothetical protein
MPEVRKNSYKIRSIGRIRKAILIGVVLFLNSLTSLFAQSGNDTTVLQKSVTDSIIQVKYPISKDKLGYIVEYSSSDSIVYNAQKKELYLHNMAEIAYDDIKVNADYIIYQQDSSLLSAYEISANPSDTANKPRLSQGTESSTFTSLHYNFKSKRALVENAYSQYGEGFILSKQVKRNNDETINGFRNVYTTCNDPHPHFGIAARKIKIIPNKVAVSGSANLVIEDIPTPLYLPFGMFPLTKGQRSGIKLPTYDMSEVLGFGLREFGYYFAISDYVDLLATADFYALGTYRVGFISNYVKRYKYNGRVNFNYSYTKVGEPFEIGSTQIRNYSIMWSHSISQQVNPGTSFNANVNIVNNRNYQLFNTYDANTYLNNNLSSAIAYSKNWAGKPFNLTAALRHNQNTLSREVRLTLPEVAFTVNQLPLFQFRKDIIKPRWYEKITASYQFMGLNRYDFYDSSFSLSNFRFRDLSNGFKHFIPLNANYNILKFINTSVNFNYNEYWFTQKTFKQYDIRSQRLDTLKQFGFFTARDFNMSTSLSTRIYGIKLFKKGSIKGIRHVMTPSLTFRYQPDFGSGIGNYYYNTFIDSNFRTGRYSYFENNPFGVLPPDGRFGGINFGLGNTLQLKVGRKKDSTGAVKKVNLIDGLDIGGSYNLAVDSFRLSNIGIRYRTNLSEQINISGGLLYDPYSIDKTTGRRSKISNLEANGKLMQFRSADFAIRASLPAQKRTADADKSNNTNERDALGSSYGMYTDFNIPWRLTINYTVGIQKNFVVASQKDTLALNQNLLFDGEVNLTEKWRIGLSSGFDFISKQLTYTSFDIFRDLHCWEMRMGLIPFGPRRSYNFSLNVKSAVLQDLKLVRRKDFRDNL